MRDTATVSTHGPRPVAYVTTAAGTAVHFTDVGQLADWLAARPGFPHQDVLDRLVAALDGRRAARNPHPPVDEVLAMVASLNQRSPR